MIEQCIIEIGPCDSVMSEIKTQFKKVHPNNGTMWITPYQHAGRGQAGNSWQSNAAENLLFGMVLYPSFIEPAEQFLVSKIVALVYCRSVGAIYYRY